VLFESGNRVRDAIVDLAAIMGDREAAICRELTKLHEDTTRAPLSELANNADKLETRGEFVLVIAPPPEQAQPITADALDDLLRSSLRDASVRDTVAHAVEISGRPRREIYARALELAREVSAGSHAKAAHEKT
jgi:16S rRNA (cytidine1402-2'-O)-methyltransferase